MDFDPLGAVQLGLHQYDGKVPDRTPLALRNEAARLEREIAALEALPAEELGAELRLEHAILLTELRRRRFELVDLDAWHQNPIVYVAAVDLAAYVLRDYAPLAARAKAIMATCAALPEYLAQARANLAVELPLAWIETASVITRGHIDFINTDIRQKLNQRDPSLPDAEDLNEALDTCVAALAEQARWLDNKRVAAVDSYALGEAKFMAMFRATQGIDVDRATLERVIQADLAKNRAALDEAARAIDATRTTAEVVLTLADDKPPGDDGVALARAQSAELRQFLIDHEIVSIPFDDPIDVRATPPAERTNGAALNTAGPLEPTPLPSYYYIAPPDPSWSAADRRAYQIPAADLFFVTVHEVWPGHFLQALHAKKHRSPIVLAFGTYTNVEGWAHYAEEMMYEAGAGGQTPQKHVGQLKEALLRDVRALVALGLHAGHLDVPAATKMFQELAFVDPQNARQQALRGTRDPMYLSYTIGKLVIMKLRADWQAKQGATYSLGAFHDTFLGFAGAPLPYIRRAMLGDDTGPIL